MLKLIVDYPDRDSERMVLRQNTKKVNIDDLIESVINKQISNEQFVNADITFKEITQLKKLFKNKLVNIHHARIEY